MRGLQYASLFHVLLLLFYILPECELRKKRFRKYINLHFLHLMPWPRGGKRAREGLNFLHWKTDIDQCYCTFFLIRLMIPILVNTCVLCSPSRGTPSLNVSLLSVPGSHRWRRNIATYALQVNHNYYNCTTRCVFFTSFCSFSFYAINFILRPP